MERMAVLDFETATHQPGSACQLGIVVVEPWCIVSEHQWLIRPQRLYFSPRCVQVHGITPRDVMDSPTWDRIWPEVLAIIDGCTVVAHNAGFDANVLSATCRAYDIAVSPIDLQCTRLLAKRTWPALRSHALAAMAEHLGIRFQHHDALEDARAAATLLMKSAALSSADDLNQLEDRLGLVRGRIWTDRIRQPRTLRRSRLERVDEPQPRYEAKTFRRDGAPPTASGVREARWRADAILIASQNTRPLEGKHVVLVHTLLGLDREDSVGFLAQLGATVQPRITLQTHYMIMGTASGSELSNLNRESAMEGSEAGAESSRTTDAARRSEAGQPIRILSQRQLLAMLPSGLAIARGDG